jgi:hypothetical protein
MLGLKPRNDNEIDNVFGERRTKTVASQTESNLFVTFSGRRAKEGDCFLKNQITREYEKTAEQNFFNGLHGGRVFLEGHSHAASEEIYGSLCNQDVKKFSHSLWKSL